MAVAVVAMLVLVLTVPPLREVMGLAWPDGTSMQAAPLMVACSAAWLFAVRRFVRGRRAEPPPTT